MPEINANRIRRLNKAAESNGPVIYWMSREQRTNDNWALLYAQQLAIQSNSPLVVVFCLVPEFLGSIQRQYRFMIEGLTELEKELRRFNIPFYLLSGKPAEVIPQFVITNNIKALVADFSPLRISRRWKNSILRKISIPFYEVDAHNIIPCWQGSDKQEYGARTFRGKVQRLLPEYLTEFPRLQKLSEKMSELPVKNDSHEAVKTIKARSILDGTNLFSSGEKAAARTMIRFFEKTYADYFDKRNDPGQDFQSNLSPYLHFGQISAQRIALEAQKRDGNIKSQESFLEELIVRRELSDNFCFYNSKYDSFSGFPDWAQRSLDGHRSDERHYIYSRDELEQALTHDRLWNAAQLEMVYGGKMHGYLRMYWAKKILEWSPSPEEALKTAIFLNDRYELDGRDPNGYTGIAWSIGGVHDRAWPEREIFGKIRYMSYDGCRRKFDIEAYIKRTAKLGSGLAE